MSAPLVTIADDAIKATAAITAAVEQRDKEENTPAMIAAKTAQLTQSEKDAVNAAIAKNDIAQERKDDAE